MNILLVEPDYRSKFPPLGLLRIASFHRDRGDCVSFVRGKSLSHRLLHWDRIYVSSLFTYELPKTVECIRFYLPCVHEPSDDIVVGGIGATLLPSYISSQVVCRVVEGSLDRPNMLGLDEPPIAGYIPDYELLNNIDYEYLPRDAFFIRISKGCIRKCKFCAVPILEPRFGYLQGISEQLPLLRNRFGDRTNLVVLDNNVLALPTFPQVIDELVHEGYHRGARLAGKRRSVDFNQGIDARLINPTTARLLGRICLSPVRLAFDQLSVERAYRTAVKCLAEEGFKSFTTYLLFNYEDDPISFYHRMLVNLELSAQLGIRITGFPMRYTPTNDITRRFVAKKWRWKYLRGIQCILNATHGMVSPNPSFFTAAFGSSVGEFLEILAMPDHYIIYRSRFREQAEEWRSEFRRFTQDEREQLLELLAELKGHGTSLSLSGINPKFWRILEHYFDP